MVTPKPVSTAPSPPAADGAVGRLGSAPPSSACGTSTSPTLKPVSGPATSTSASSCRNAAGNRIAVRARPSAGAPSAGVPVHPQIMNGVSFPQLAARDLGGREVALPAGLPGERNVVLIAFRRDQ